MRILSQLRVLLGLALAAVPFFIASAPGCGGTSIIMCPEVYDPDRIGLDGDPDPCCDRTDPCPPPGAGKDAGSDADPATNADGGPPPTDAATDADTATDADAATDAEADAGPPPCAGECLDLPSSDWFGPVLFRKGNVGDTIDCPAAAPVVDYTGFTDLLDVGPAACGACGCGSSTGTCGPPEHLTANTLTCPGGGSPTPFDPVPGWDGSCSSVGHVGPGSKSLTSGPLTVTEGCAPAAGEPSTATTPAGFGASVMACRGTTSLCDPGHVCAPTDPAFQACIWQAVDVPICPQSYPLRIPVAGGFDDQRACAPCACGAVDGSSCSATLTVYSDLVCGPLSQFLATTVWSTAAPCFDLPPSAALGSKTLTAVKYASGTCAPSGGEPTGGVLPAGVATFCCLP